MLRNISCTIYEANKAVFKLLCDGFILNREDRTQKDLYIELIDFDTPENNIFKVVNQFEIEGVNNQLRIPDGIVFVNGIPVVVLEFKSAVQENTTSLQSVTVEIFRRFSNTMRLLLSVTEQIINMVLSSAHMISSMRGER